MNVPTEKKCNYKNFLFCRLQHLKAYYRFIKHNDMKAFSMLDSAKNLAIKYENLIEVSWIEHSEKVLLERLLLNLVITITFCRLGTKT